MRTLGILALLGTAFLTQGCAIFVRGDLQDVTVRSDAPDVRVDVDGQPLKLAGVASADSNAPATAAGTIELDRHRIHVFHAEAPGYDPLEVTVYPSLNDDWMFAEQCTMWPVLWLPMAIDYNTGALYDLPETLDLKLTKSKAPPELTGGNPPSTTVPAAEIQTTRIVIRKPPRAPESVGDSNTARMGRDED